MIHLGRLTAAISHFGETLLGLVQELKNPLKTA